MLKNLMAPIATGGPLTGSDTCFCQVDATVSSRAATTAERPIALVPTVERRWAIGTMTMHELAYHLAVDEADILVQQRRSGVVEPEADAAHGGYPALTADLAAQPGHVHVQRLGRLHLRVVPHLTQDLLAGHHLARAQQQHPQQLELLVG